MKPIVLLLGGLGLVALAVAASGSPTTAVGPAPLPKWPGAPKSMEDAEARQGFLKVLRPDASVNADGYSQATYYVVDDGQGNWVKAAPGVYGAMYVDDWGRLVSGVSGNPLGVALQAAGIALPFIPGVGPAASAALATAIALGKGESLKDAALAGARAALPGGPAAQLAFDLGVGVATGSPVDDAAKQALLAQVPAGTQAYLDGYKLAKEVFS